MGVWHNEEAPLGIRDRKSTRLNSSHPSISYAVFCLKKKNRDSRQRILAITNQHCTANRHRHMSIFDQVSLCRREDELAIRDVHLAVVFFFNVTATTEIYTLSLHDALPI